MQIIMQAMLAAEDIAKAVAAYVSSETGSTVNAEDVTVPKDYVVTVQVGKQPELPTPSNQGKKPASSSRKTAAVKVEEPVVEKEPESDPVTEDDVSDEDTIPETSQESETDKTEEETVEKPGPKVAAVGGARKGGSIFNFEKK